MVTNQIIISSNRKMHLQIGNINDKKMLYKDDSIKDSYRPSSNSPLLLFILLKSILRFTNIEKKASFNTITRFRYRKYFNS